MDITEVEANKVRASHMVPVGLKQKEEKEDEEEEEDEDEEEDKEEEVNLGEIIRVTGEAKVPSNTPAMESTEGKVPHLLFFGCIKLCHSVMSSVLLSDWV